MVREALVRAERVRDRCQRLLHVLAQHVLVRDVVRNLAHAVHVVGERDQAGRLVGEFLERAADPARAGDFAERADVGQAGRAVAGLEGHDRPRFALRLVALHALKQLARFFERPGLGGHCEVSGGHLPSLKLAQCIKESHAKPRRIAKKERDSHDDTMGTMKVAIQGA